MDNSIILRFWENINKTDSCWNWTGTIDAHGNPIIRIYGLGYYPRRICMEIHGKEFGKRVITTCDNKLCVNPDHLISGDEERFWNNVDKSGDCWLWTATKDKDNYGKFRYSSNKKKLDIRAHRYSYELHNGPIKDNLFVCHTCDNPTCVNPDHLFLGTVIDNAHDCVNKGRIICGEKSYLSKLTDAQAIEIKEKYANGYTLNKLSQEYGVRVNAIRELVNEITWKHLNKERAKLPLSPH